MKYLLTVLLSLAAPLAFGSQLTVTCGNGSYDSLEQGNLDLAEFVLVLKLKGPNATPEVLTLSDEGQSLEPNVLSLSYAGSDIKLQMKNYDKYEITEIAHCDDLDQATGKIAYYKHVGGFAGYAAPVRATCSCAKK